MELLHIEVKSCPTCGKPPCEESVETDTNGRVREHTNGMRWEKRRFLCGLTLSFVPNFERVEVTSACTQSPQFAAEKKQREAAVYSLLRLVRDLNVDDAFRTAARRHVEELRYVPSAVRLKVVQARENR